MPYNKGVIALKRLDSTGAVRRHRDGSSESVDRYRGLPKAVYRAFLRAPWQRPGYLLGGAKEAARAARRAIAQAA